MLGMCGVFTCVCMDVQRANEPAICGSTKLNSTLTMPPTMKSQSKFNVPSLVHGSENI